MKCLGPSETTLQDTVAGRMLATTTGQVMIQGKVTTVDAVLTMRLWTMGTGVTQVCAGPIASKNVYSALSVLMIVHEAPSLIMSLFGSLAHGVAFKHTSLT